MKTPLQLALEHARVYARERGGKVEPLTWQEVALILRVPDSYERGFDLGYAIGLANGRKQAAS